MSRVLWDTGYSITVEAAFSAAAGAFGVWDSAVWDDATWGPDVVWSDVSQDLYAWTSKIGRDRENDHYVAATGSVALDNSEGNYTPENLDGDYVAAGVTGVRPGRPLRGYITRISDGARFPLFYGTIEDFDETVVSKAPRTTFAWVDGIADLAAADGYERDPVGGGESVGVRMHRILDDAEWEQPRDIDVGSTTVQATTLAQPAWTELLLSSDSEGGETWVNPDGTFVFQDREGPLRNSRSNAVQYVFTDTDAPGALHYEDLQLASGMDILVTDAALARAGGQVIVRSDLEARALYRMHRWGRSDLICETDAQVEMLASTVVARRSNPERRPRSIRLRPRVSPEILAVVVALRLWDRVTVTRQHERSETTITHDCFVDGIEHTFSGGDWVTVVRLASADAFATADQFGVWGTSLWDTAVWAPARVSAAIVSGPPAETGLPDMRVDDIGWDGLPGTGDDVVFWAVVKNYGTASTPLATITDCAFFIDGVTVSWSDDHATRVAPGETVILSATGGPDDNNVWTATEGLHTVTAIVNTGLTGTGRYEESDRSNNSRFEFINVVTSGGVGDDPSDIAGLLLWVKGDADVTGSSNASAWADQSGNGNDFTQATGANQPATGSRSIHSINALDFQTGDWMDTGAFTITQPFTIVCEVQFDNAAATLEFLGAANDDWYAYIASNVYLIGAGGSDINGGSTDTSKHKFLAVFDGASSAIYVDDFATPVVTANPGTNGSTGAVRVGAGAGGAASLDGPLAEVMIYDSALDATDRGRLETYLAGRYDASGGGGGGGGPAGAGELWPNLGVAEAYQLTQGTQHNSSLGLTAFAATFDGVDISHSRAWRDGPTDWSNVNVSGTYYDMSTIVPALLAAGLKVRIGGHIGKGGPPAVGDSTELADWVVFMENDLDAAAAMGAQGVFWDGEPYAPGDAGSYEGHSTDSAAWVAALEEVGAYAVSAGLDIRLYLASTCYWPGSNNDELLFQNYGSHFYGDNRWQDFMRGLDNTTGLNYGIYDASWHHKMQNSIPADYDEGVQRSIDLTTDTIATSAFATKVEFPNCLVSIMGWPDLMEPANSYWSDTEITDIYNAALRLGTCGTSIYHWWMVSHSTDFGSPYDAVDSETFWNDTGIPALIAARP